MEGIAYCMSLSRASAWNLVSGCSLKYILTMLISPFGRLSAKSGFTRIEMVG